MQIASGQLSNHFAKGLRSLYTLHGDEPLLVQEAADAIRDQARKQGFSERSSFTVAGAYFDWGEVLAIGLSVDVRVAVKRHGWTPIRSSYCQFYFECHIWL